MALTDNILAYWKLDNNGSGGVSLVDSTPNGNTLTNNNGVTLAVGKINGAAGFDGSVGPLDRSSVVSSGGSLSFWYKAQGSWQTPISQWSNGGWKIGYAENSNQFYFFTGEAYYFTTTAAFDGNWHHVVVSNIGSGTVAFYFDGFLDGTKSFDGIDFSKSFTLGSDVDGNEKLNGSIDEVGIWNRGLSDSEVTALYNSGAGLSYPFGAVVASHKNIVPRSNNQGKLGTPALRWAEGHFQSALTIGGSPVATVNELAPVATSGSASDLTEGTLPLAQLDALVSRDNQNNNFTEGQTITAAANTSALTAIYSVTGANTTALVNLSGTWNTTGAATGIRLNITDTASAATSLLVDLGVGSRTQYAFTKSRQFWLFNSSPATQDASNFERAFMRWNSNVLEIGTEAGGTGTARGLNLQTNGTSRVFISAVGAVQFGPASADGNFSKIAYDGGNNLNFVNPAILRWTNGTTASPSQSPTFTSGLSQNAAGVLEVNNGTAGTFRDLRVRNVIQRSGVGTTVTPASNGDLVIEQTSNTSITFKMRGTDGTPRSASLTLA